LRTCRRNVLTELALFQTVLRCVADGVFTVDREWRITSFNKAVERIKGVTPAVMEVFMRHDLAGNARELDNLIEYCFVLCHNGLIDVRHLPEELQGKAPRVAATPLQESHPATATE